MRILFFFIMFVNVNFILAENLEGVYFKKNPKRIVFFKMRPRVVPKQYIYVHFNSDTTMIYINTIGWLGRSLQTMEYKYKIENNVFIFEKTLGAGDIIIDTGEIKNDILYISFCGWELKKAKLSDVEKFIKEYSDYLKEWKKICFHNGYTVPCNSP